MRTIFIDTNIFLDYFFDRKGLADNAQKILELCINKEVKGYTSPKTILDINYLTQKQFNKSKAKAITKYLLDYFEIEPINKAILLSAVASEFTDFEDGVQHYTALQIAGIDCIVTNNTKDFKASFFMVLSAADFLKKW